jgi:hypothetical protein
MRSATPLGRIDVMSRKDYRLIAAALREERREAADKSAFDRPPWEAGTYDEWGTVVIRLARALSADGGYDLNGNRRFKTDVFYAACGFRA